MCRWKLSGVGIGPTLTAEKNSVDLKATYLIGSKYTLKTFEECNTLCEGSPTCQSFLYGRPVDPGRWECELLKPGFTAVADVNTDLFFAMNGADVTLPSNTIDTCTHKESMSKDLAKKTLCGTTNLNNQSGCIA